MCSIRSRPPGVTAHQSSVVVRSCLSRFSMLRGGASGRKEHRRERVGEGSLHCYAAHRVQYPYCTGGVTTTGSDARRQWVTPLLSRTARWLTSSESTSITLVAVAIRRTRRTDASVHGLGRVLRTLLAVPVGNPLQVVGDCPPTDPLSRPWLWCGSCSSTRPKRLRTSLQSRLSVQRR